MKGNLLSEFGVTWDKYVTDIAFFPPSLFLLFKKGRLEKDWWEERKKERKGVKRKIKCGVRIKGLTGMENCKW